jgi:VanZ family protein
LKTARIKRAGSSRRVQAGRLPYCAIMTMAMIGGTVTAEQTGARWFWVLLWILVMIGTFWGELLPGSSMVLTIVGRISDKVVHFSSYTALAFIPAMGFRRPAGTACALAMIPAGVVLEFLQRLVPGRSFEVADMAANTAGVLTGLTIAAIYRKAKARA